MVFSMHNDEMMNGMFVLRQRVEKRLQVQGEICGPAECLQHCPERDGDGYTEMDGSAEVRLMEEMYKGM